MTQDERDTVIDECIQTVMSLCDDSDLTPAEREKATGVALVAAFRLRMLQAKHAEERAKLPASWR